MPFGLYVHVPFCVSKCHYCDFYSERIKANNVASFLRGLALEVNLLGEMVSSEAAQPNSIYLGGGTPSVLTAEQLNYALEIIGNTFSVDKAQEVTIEINPGTVTKDDLAVYRQLAINRLSVGVQSFDDQDLEAMGRKHRVDQTMELISWIHELGFNNFSIDLIYGLPGQSLRQWEHNLKRAVECKPKHISLYGLKLEETTCWGRLLEAGKLAVPDDEHQAEMYLLAVEILTEAGFSRYEISNFAQDGYQSKHNLLYWQNEPYLGLGPGASSHYLHKRWMNVTDIDEYVAMLQEEKLPLTTGEDLTGEIREAETIFLGLRLAEGIDVVEVNKKFKIDFLAKYQKQVDRFSKKGLLEVAEGKVKLTLTGVLLANEVFIEFLPGNQANYLDKS